MHTFKAHDPLGTQCRYCYGWIDDPRHGERTWIVPPPPPVVPRIRKPAHPDTLITVGEICRTYHVGPHTVYRWRKRGQITPVGKPVGSGGGLRFRAGDVYRLGVSGLFSEH